MIEYLNFIKFAMDDKNMKKLDKDRLFFSKRMNPNDRSIKRGHTRGYIAEWLSHMTLVKLLKLCAFSLPSC